MMTMPCRVCVRADAVVVAGLTRAGNSAVAQVLVSLKVLAWVRTAPPEAAAGCHGVEAARPSAAKTSPKRHLLASRERCGGPADPETDAETDRKATVASEASEPTEALAQQCCVRYLKTERGLIEQHEQEVEAEPWRVAEAAEARAEQRCVEDLQAKLRLMQQHARTTMSFTRSCLSAPAQESDHMGTPAQRPVGVGALAAPRRSRKLHSPPVSPPDAQGGEAAAAAARRQRVVLAAAQGEPEEPMEGALPFAEEAAGMAEALATRRCVSDLQTRLGLMEAQVRKAAGARRATSQHQLAATVGAAASRTASARSIALARELQQSRQQELALSSPLSLVAEEGPAPAAADARPISAATSVRSDSRLRDLQRSRRLQLRTVSARSEALAREMRRSRREELAMASFVLVDKDARGDTTRDDFTTPGERRRQLQRKPLLP